jgi:hypothetical protein
MLMMSAECKYLQLLLRLSQSPWSAGFTETVSIGDDCAQVYMHSGRLSRAKYSSPPPVSAGDTFQDLPRVPETANSSESYIQGYSKWLSGF